MKDVEAQLQRSRASKRDTLIFSLALLSLSAANIVEHLLSIDFTTDTVIETG